MVTTSCNDELQVIIISPNDKCIVMIIEQRRKKNKRIKLQAVVAPTGCHK